MFRSAAALVLLSLLACSPAESVAPRAQRPPAPARQAEPGVPAAFFPAPDRKVAEIVSPIWNTETRRDAADESGQLVRALDIRPGMTVGDIGAGAGYHTLRLSPVVGPTGRIVAEDVEATYLRELARTVEQKGLANVTLALGEPHDPQLAPASLDLALLVHMYHEVTQPYAFLYNLAPAVKPGGRVAVVDLEKDTHAHGTPLALLRCEFEAVGYRLQEVQALQGGVGYLAVFTPPTERPEPRAIRPCRGRR